MQSQPVDPQVLHAAMALIALMPVFALIGAAIVIVPSWFIWKKAGFSPWFSLLTVLPLVNLIMLYVLAFSEWKVAPVGQQPYPAATPPQYPRV
jgi:ABC-type transport system involved in cytochrome c biogenesis permease subunit